MTDIETTNSKITDFKTYLTEEKPKFIRLFTTPTNITTRIDDYEFLGLLGAGAFGKVVLASPINQKDKLYAIKVIEKQYIVKLRQTNNIMNEKRVLIAGRFPFILNMETYFMDNSYLYFVLPYMVGGDLFDMIKIFGRIDEATSKFYAAQVCFALEYLHFMDIIHRDLKPENVLMDAHGYVKLSDFGFCKIVHGRTATFCGTPDYLAPEILMSQGYGQAVDWWSFGVFIYELNYGLPPFYDKDDTKRYHRITNARYSMPVTFTPYLGDLLEHLLEKDLTKRFGNLERGADDIKGHPWFKEIHWLGILNRVVIAPYKPNTIGRHKYTQFDKHNLHTSPVNTYSSEFKDF